MRLYALLDEQTLARQGWSLERFVGRVDRLGAEIIQYRNKDGDLDFIEERLRTLTELFGGRVIVNDYPELAYICGGVHIGQEDLLRYAKTPPRAVDILRGMVGKDRWIGISTHDEREILVANSLDIDYIGLGACRVTHTKEDAGVLGIERVGELAAVSIHPVAAIGGVRLDDVIPNVTYSVVGSALYED